MLLSGSDPYASLVTKLNRTAPRLRLPDLLAFAARDSNYPVLTSLETFAVPQAVATVGAAHSDFAFDSGVDRDWSDCHRVWINVGCRRASVLAGRSGHVE